MAHKRARDTVPVAELPAIPEMDAVVAQQFAKLLNSGCPPVRATLYLVPWLDMDNARELTAQWMADPHVIQEFEELNGGPWQDLPEERRFEIAYHKHLSEVCFYLQTTNFVEVEAKEALEKMKRAFDIVKAEVKGTSDPTDPSEAFARFALELVKSRAELDAQKATAPQLGPSTLKRDLSVTVTPGQKES